MQPPRMFLMPGVIRSNVHDRLTVAASPMSSARAIATRVAEDGGRAPSGRRRTVGSLQFVAAASFRIWFWYFAWTLASPPPLPRRRVVGGQVRRDAAHALEVDPAEVDATEVERDERQEQEDRQDDRELDEALASAAAMAVDAAGPASVAGGEKRI